MKTKGKNILEFFGLRRYATVIVLLSVFLQLSVYIYYLVSKQMHVDEVMMLTNARCIAKNGADITGEVMPAYFDTWLIGGQSPLPTYIAALLIKIFGYHIWLVRIPLLVLSVFGLIAFKELLKSIFSNNAALQNIVLTFVAFSPWRIFQSVWEIDYAYLAHFFIIGLYFLNKSIFAKQSIKNMLLSMLFFALGCYSYIAGIITVSVFLLIYYLVLLNKKKISFRFSVVSFFSFALMLVPFVLSVLVLTNSVNGFRFLGFSFQNNEVFGKASVIAANADIGITDFITNNIIGVINTVFVPDLTLFMGTKTDVCLTAPGVLSYGHIVSSLCIILFIIYAILKRKKVIKSKRIQVKVLTLSFFVSFLVYSFTLNYAINASHRYSQYYYLFNIFSGAGAYILLKSTEKKTKPAIIKAFAVICLALSVAITALGVIGFADNNSNTAVAKSLDYGLQSAEKNEDEKIVFVSDNRDDKMRYSIYLRYRYFDNIEIFKPFEKELYSISKSSSITVADINGKYTISDITNNFSEDMYIICTDDFDNEYGKTLNGNYKLLKKGYINVLQKNK